MGLTVFSVESLAAEITYEFSGGLSDSLLQPTITSYIAMDTDKVAEQSYTDYPLESPQFVSQAEVDFITLVNVGELYYSNTSVFFNLVPDF